MSVGSIAELRAALAVGAVSAVGGERVGAGVERGEPRDAAGQTQAPRTGEHEQRPHDGQQRLAASVRSGR